MDIKDFNQYLIYDIMNLAYKVYVSKDKDLIYIYKKEKKTDRRFLTIQNPVSVFVGEDYSKLSEGGKTLLINLSGNKYLFIGGDIYSFVSRDKIIKFYSNTLPNNISFPIAEGEKNLYFMYDYKIVPKNLFQTKNNEETSNAYSMFYTIPKNIKSLLRNFENFERYEKV